MSGMIDVVNCDNCSLEVKMYCKSCDLKLCAECGGKHVAERASNGHSIVSYSERYSEPVLPNCKDHENACSSLCADCQIAVCARCIIESHEDHRCTDLLKESIKKRQAIQIDTKELEVSIIQTLQNLFDEMLKKKQQLPHHHEPLILAVQKQGAELHRIIDRIVENKLAHLNKIMQEQIIVLEKNMENISKLLEEANALDEKLRKSLRENFAVEFLRFQLNLENFDSLSVADVHLPTFIPKSIDEEKIANMLGDFKIGKVASDKKISIRKSKNLRRVEPSEVAVGTMKSGLGCAALLARISSEEVWVARRSSLRRLNKKNEILENVELPNGIVLDICLLGNRDPVLSNNIMKTINVYKNGGFDTLIRLAKWSPFGVSATSTGDLLVSMRRDSDHQGKVVRFSGSSGIQEIQCDSENKPLFSTMATVLFVAENKNSDICVSDPGSEAVIVVNKSGKLKFRYFGNLHVKMFKCFTPYGIVTDTMSQILVADRDNDCIHVIDCGGHFLRYITGCGLHQPFSLSITNKNLLFVGSGTEDKISVIKYTE